MTMTAPRRTPTIEQVASLVVLGDLVGHLAQSLLDLRLGEEDVDEVVLHVGRVHGRQPRASGAGGRHHGGRRHLGPPSSGALEDQHAVAADRAERTGQVDPASGPRQPTRSLSTASTWSRVSSDGGAPGVEGGAVEHAVTERRSRGGAGSRSRPVRRARRAASAARSARSSSSAVSSRSWSAVRASASAIPGPELGLEDGQHPVRRTRTRVKDGSSLCGSSQKSSPSTWHAVTVSSRRTSSSGRANTPKTAACPAATGRPSPG